MKILKINLDKPDKEIIDKAVKVLRAGGTVVYPTETCYGLAADALNPRAIKKIFKIKKRPSGAPLSVIVESQSRAKKFVQFSPRALKLAKKHWLYGSHPYKGGLSATTSKMSADCPQPGRATTLVLPIKNTSLFHGREKVRYPKKLLDILTGSKKFLGIRVSPCEVARELARKLSRPITATSANISGHPECYSIQAVVKQFKLRKYKPDLILDADQLPRRKPSKIVKIIGDKIEVLRK